MTDRRFAYTDFLLRRVHSLSGIVPLTGFIFFHFFANSYSTLGKDPYNHTVDQLRGLPFLPGIEWVFIFGPFLFHMLLGVWIVFSGHPNPLRNNYRRNWAYLVQRITALIVFVFVLYHVIGLHYLEPATDHKTGRTDFYTYLNRAFANPFVYWWYVIAIAATVFHIANGICTFLMTWGITVGQKSQRITAYAMTALGVVLFVLGISSISGFLHPKKEAVPTSRGAMQTSQQSGSNVHGSQS